MMEHKLFSVEVKEWNAEDLTVEHWISTERRDRGGDVLYAGPNGGGQGMITEGKPVVLHSHGYGPMGSEPIAKCLWLKTGEFRGHKGIRAKTQFYDGSHLNPPDNTGRRLWEKTTQGIMGAWSVGWQPLKFDYKTDRGNGEQTRHVYEWLLLEYSMVSVPMAPDAMTASIGNQLSFKIMPSHERKHGEFFQERGQWYLHVDDALLRATARKTIRDFFNKLRGRVP